MPSNKLVGPNQRWVVEGLVNTVHVYMWSCVCLCDSCSALCMTLHFWVHLLYTYRAHDSWSYSHTGHTCTGRWCSLSACSCDLQPDSRERERHIELTTILPQRTVHQKGLTYYYIYMYFATSFVEPCRQWHAMTTSWIWEPRELANIQHRYLNLQWMLLCFGRDVWIGCRQLDRNWGPMLLKWLMKKAVGRAQLQLLGNMVGIWWLKNVQILKNHVCILHPHLMTYDGGNASTESRENCLLNKLRLGRAQIWIGLATGQSNFQW